MMKVLLIFAAMLLAASSVAAAKIRTDERAATIVATDQPGCHDGARSHGPDQAVACDFTAFCPLLCGVVPPAAPEKALAGDLYPLAYLVASTILHDAARKPEPPPPRIRSR